MKSRHLSEGELDMLASAFAVTNYGLASRVSTPGAFTLAQSHSDPIVSIALPGSEEMYEHAGSVLRSWAMNMFADGSDDPEEVVTGEFEDWKRTLRKMTLEQIGATWKDMADAMKAFEDAPRPVRYSKKKLPPIGADVVYRNGLGRRTREATVLAYERFAHGVYVKVRFAGGDSSLVCPTTLRSA